MAARAQWAAVLDPGNATDFFVVPHERPAFAPTARGFERGQAWWCSEIARTVYRRDGRAACFAAAGLDERRVFEHGSTQAVLVTAAGFAALAFRGTADLRDWLTNLRAALVPWPGGGRVHDGFVRGLDRVWSEVASELARLDQPVFVTGHSLGGALATLAAARHAFAAAYTFGAPRVGDAAFWHTLRTPLHRVVVDCDVVPTVPPRRIGYAHGGDLQLLVAAGSAHEAAPKSDLAIARRSLREQWLAPPVPLADHAPARYSALLLPPAVP